MANSDQLKQVWAIVLQALPTRLTWAQAQYWIGHGRELAAKVRAIFTAVDPYRDVIAAWETFYRDALGITVDLSGLVVPAEKPGFGWLIVVVPGVTIERVLTAMKKYFPVWRWTDDNLDQLTESVRSAADGPYAVWVRPRVEADEERTDKSYDDLKKDGVAGVTLLEYALLHLKHFVEKGVHLDSINITRCDGSLYRDGGVPSGDWGPGDGKFYVGKYRRDLADVSLRFREVVLGE
ncbi:MAG TPA: hypothetical protein VMJ72_02040 [Candidatus Paceibacterota bacterium]|nr:hypothetical protein [Candidatus Paceibacterota bacterium]